uniref:Homeobox domain-containing protein n=1 Tax=Monodon monoceros TaxID=40151 RepID=A0A8C6B133_MONMO
FPLFSPTGRLSRPSRRRRLVLSLSQKDALQALFQQNPYPGITTREWLARELDIPESRIQVWFQNQRRRRLKQSRLPSENAFKGGQSQPLRQARRKRTFISPSQTRVLVQAFERDRFPSIAAREELAHQTGIPEPRIQVSAPPVGGTWLLPRERSDNACDGMLLDIRRLGDGGLGGRSLHLRNTLRGLI